MNKNPKLSIVIPAYNEEKNIYKTINDILIVHRNLDYDCEVIVVVDGAKDNTAKEARKHRTKKVKVFSYRKNQGKGFALKYGTKKAQGEIITFVDAGGDFAPRQFDKYVRLMEIFDADFVIGSKRHPASKVFYPRKRRVYSWIYHKIIRLLFGLNVTDTQAGLKFLKKNVAKDVLPRVLVKQYAFDLEMLVVAWQLGYRRIFEAPVELDFNGEVTSIGFRTIRTMITDTLAIFYRSRVLNYYRKDKTARKKKK